MQEITFNSKEIYKLLVDVHNFIVNNLFIITPPCFGDIRLFTDFDPIEEEYKCKKILDQLETNINKLNKAKITAPDIDYIYEVFPTLKYFFEEAINMQKSENKLEKRYYNLANKLWHILP